MPTSNARRVRKLHLTAPDRPLIRHGAHLIEDALRTASLPATDGGRLLIVRSLSVGRVRRGYSSASVALVIEERMRHLGALAVYAEAPGAEHHQAVYFQDDTEPYVALALRLARGKRPSAWFWPLAVLEWRPELERGTALLHLVYGAAGRSRAGSAAALRVVQELHRKNLLNELLAALQEADAPALMQTFGWRQPDPPVGSARRLPTVEPVPVGWGRTLAYWGERWGQDDVRSLWLATTALAAAKPARLYDSHLATRAETLVRTLQPQLLVPLANGDSGVEGVAAAEVLSVPAAARTGDDDGVPSTRTDVTASGDTLGRATNATFARPPSAQAGLIADPGSTGHAAEFMLIREAITGRERVNVTGHIEGQAPDGPGHGPLDDSRSHPVGAVPAIELAGGNRLPEPCDYQADDGMRWPDSPRPTTFAGLFFLLPILADLGMAEWLAEDSIWLDDDLPFLLLRYFCGRLGAAAGDPLLAVLAAAGRDGETARRAYTAPLPWRQAICHPGPVQMRRVPGDDPLRVLYDGSGRLPLAFWRGPTPELVQGWLAYGVVDGGRGAPNMPDPDLVCLSWYSATRRWCRRHAHMGLRDLVCRPGHVAATPTHIDVYFELKQADVRVRRAGLDTDPGWVAWLGRVVYFHYYDGRF